jgi:hypothetical protein
LLLVAVALAAQETQEKKSPIRNSPEFSALKALVGDWEGTGTDSGQTFPATATVRLTSGGSVLMHTLSPGGPEEMVSMIHPDGNDLLLTHYCAAHNQPRFKAAKLDGQKVTFQFKDITNLEHKGDGHMHSVTFSMTDADNHTEDWSYLDHGKRTTGHFEFHRKK